MEFTSEFLPLSVGDLRRETAFLKADGWRFVQTHAVNTDDGVDLYYSFMKDGNLRNYRIAGITPENEVPSITDLFIAAFVFENEARELFGVTMGPIAIDFDGRMYNPVEPEPMTFISPEQKAAKEKARKVAAAKAAKTAALAGEPQEGSGPSEIAVSPAAGSDRRFVMTPELQARLDRKLPTMSPEKVAKVQAALAALASADDLPLSAEEARTNAREEGDQLAEQPSEADAIDKAIAEDIEENLEADSTLLADSDQELETLLSLMDEERAAKVKAAIQKEGE